MVTVFPRGRVHPGASVGLVRPRDEPLAHNRAVVFRKRRWWGCGYWTDPNSNSPLQPRRRHRSIRCRVREQTLYRPTHEFGLGQVLVTQGQHLTERLPDILVLQMSLKNVPPSTGLDGEGQM